MGRSDLNAHKFQINLTDSDLCLCSRSETTLHFMCQCFLYTEERLVLYEAMEQILPKFKFLNDQNKWKMILNGIDLISDETDSWNRKNIFYVQNYLLKTVRF